MKFLNKNQMMFLVFWIPVLFFIMMNFYSGIGEQVPVRETWQDINPITGEFVQYGRIVGYRSATFWDMMTAPLILYSFFTIMLVFFLGYEDKQVVVK